MHGNAGANCSADMSECAAAAIGFAPVLVESASCLQLTADRTDCISECLSICGRSQLDSFERNDRVDRQLARGVEDCPTSTADPTALHFTHSQFVFPYAQVRAGSVTPDSDHRRMLAHQHTSVLVIASGCLVNQSLLQKDCRIKVDTTQQVDVERAR